MSTIFDYMAKTHVQCDELFAKAENLAAESKWSDLSAAFKAVVDEIERHLKREENVLFPAAERVMGSSGGPTQVMRMEHGQMRDLIESLSKVAALEDKDEFLGEAETLLVLMQQHNMKEEQILYPMIDRMLGEQSDNYISAMEEI